MFQSQINRTFQRKNPGYGNMVLRILAKIVLTLFFIWSRNVLYFRYGRICCSGGWLHKWNQQNSPENHHYRKKDSGPWFKITYNLQQKKTMKKTWQKSQNSGLWSWSSVVAEGWLAGKIPCAHFPAQWTNPSPLPSPLPYPSPPYLASWNMIIIFAAALFRIFIIHGSHMKMLHEMYNFNKTLVESFAAVIM